MSTFNLGDIVTLKSGSPYATIVGLPTGQGSSSHYTCKFFYQEKEKTFYAPGQALKQVVTPDTVVQGAPDPTDLYKDDVYEDSDSCLNMFGDYICGIPDLRTQSDVVHNVIHALRLRRYGQPHVVSVAGNHVFLNQVLVFDTKPWTVSYENKAEELAQRLRNAVIKDKNVK